MPNLEKDFETMILNYLLEKGYPRNSIVLEGKIDARMRPDFIIVDIDTGLPLMIIELKMCGIRMRDAVRKMSFETLKRYYIKIAHP